MKQQFFKYVLQNIAGMIGVSFYILADTFFISLYSGADGITILNLALPVYGLIFAIGAMVGIGSATRYAIRKAQGKKDIDTYFTNAVLWDLLLSIPFMLLGIFAPEQVLQVMGADAQIMELGKSYVRIFLMFTPFFMINYIFTAFARNDNAPTIAMLGSLAGSLSNIVFDYVFMFPMNLGLTGAALATAASPVITILICSIHYLGKNNTIPFRWKLPSVKQLFSCCQLGVSAFVGEVSSAVTTAVFNLLILGIAGNIGVAAYGIVANLSLVAMAIFNGIAQGTQPLISGCYGRGEKKEVGQLIRLAMGTALLVEAILLGGVWGFTDVLTGIFNSEGDQILQAYAHHGMQLYFLGYLFAGVNIMLISYFSATDRGKQAFSTSILRGVVAIAGCAVMMAKLWGLDGVWLSFLAAEFITSVVILLICCRSLYSAAGSGENT
ncbi:MAG: polysaccharide biosynthesis C-terminal domain-containing protein [Lachnospiraceae bacterium]|nr:polysaccharide biosynthesis C-terminal domain-containing protein [Lachnospiraceae bacterium]